MAADVSLLLKRLDFGPTPAELSAAKQAGYEASLSSMLLARRADPGAAATPMPRLGRDPYVSDPDPAPTKRVEFENQRLRQTDEITRWWLDRMTVADDQAGERLVFFWHGHWATSVAVIRSPQFMLRQQRVFREAPEFATMARQMVVDLALVAYLDGHQNSREAPNENLARELMELFMLGEGNYTERDVKEAGRALTGWYLVFGKEICGFDPTRHDPGAKTILGATRNFDAVSLVEHLLTQEACPRFIASRLWFRYGSSTVALPETVQAKMVGAFPNPFAMLHAMCGDEAFLATRGTMVKQPVEWLVGAMRHLGLRPRTMSNDTYNTLVDGLRHLGQVPFAPPNVAGWPAGRSWLTSAAAQVRLNLAATLVEAVPVSNMALDELAVSLCIDTWSNSTHSVLRDTRDPRQLLALALVSPEYLVT